MRVNRVKHPTKSIGKGPYVRRLGNVTNARFLRVIATFRTPRVVKLGVRANHHDPIPWNVYTEMNFQPPTPKRGLNRTLRVLSLLLLQHALVPLGTEVQARTRLPSNSDSDSREGDSRPYLKVAGIRPLRFAAEPRPIPKVAPKPLPPPEPVQPVVVEPTPPPAPVVEVKEPVVTPPPAPVQPAGGKSTLSILPDDTRPTSRAEDFLPFFQFPAGDGVNVVVPASAAKPPAPGQMPVSSATYQQR